MTPTDGVNRVAGVVGVPNDLEVRIPSVDERPDPDITRDAVAAIRAQLPFSSEHIKVVINNGWVTLEGQVEWVAVFDAEHKTRRGFGQIEKRGDEACRPRRIFSGVDVEHRRNGHGTGKSPLMLMQEAQQDMPAHRMTERDHRHGRA